MNVLSRAAIEQLINAAQFMSNPEDREDKLTIDTDLKFAGTNFWKVIK